MLNIWFTGNSGEYSWLFPTIAVMSNGSSVSAWSRGTSVQATPTYAGVHQIDFSSNWVCIHTNWLGRHIMGPWYLNAARTSLFANYPSNNAATFRFPRTPVIPTTKTLFGGATVVYFVDGISMFHIRDAFYWSGTADAAGTGNWN